MTGCAFAYRVLQFQSLHVSTSHIAKLTGRARNISIAGQVRHGLRLCPWDDREHPKGLVHVAELSPPEAVWKAIVRTCQSLEYSDNAERGCPLTALAAELAQVDKKVRAQVAVEPVNYKDRMIPFMPGRQAADKERAFFSIFPTLQLYDRSGLNRSHASLPTPDQAPRTVASSLC